MKYYCNPININYRYQFNADPRLHGRLQICREAADPSMILLQGALLYLRLHDAGRLGVGRSGELGKPPPAG